ncbi:MAG TPA: hypothetical protein VMI94_13075 [Bryobacteraceae bacterium]|nr:hypothetical protein [Bryobacteraceae bacterium]
MAAASQHHFHLTVPAPREQSRTFRVIFGLALAALSVVLQKLLFRTVAPESYQLLLGAVAISVMYAGVPSGLAALAVASAGKWFLFLEHHEDPRTLARFALFVFLGMLICWLGQKLDASNRRLKVLSGLLPVCAWCKKVRVDDDHWQQMEAYIHDHSEADFTHTLCPDCARRMVN